MSPRSCALEDRSAKLHQICYEITFIYRNLRPPAICVTDNNRHDAPRHCRIVSLTIIVTTPRVMPHFVTCITRVMAWLLHCVIFLCHGMTLACDTICVTVTTLAVTRTQFVSLVRSRGYEMFCVLVMGGCATCLVQVRTQVIDFIDVMWCWYDTCKDYESSSTYAGSCTSVNVRPSFLTPRYLYGFCVGRGPGVGGGGGPRRR